MRSAAVIAILGTMVANRKKHELVPRRSPEDLPELERLTALTDASLLAGNPLGESCANNIDLSGLKIPSLAVWNSIFDRVSFASCQISSLRLRDLRALKCDLSNSILRGFEASRVEIIGCRLTGLRAAECRWQDVLVEDCDMRYAQLNNSRFLNCEFRSCNLAGSDLGGSDLRGAIFSKTILRDADLSGTKLEGADLRGAEIEGVTVRVEDLRGAVVSVAQAIDLARLLGIVIE